MKHILVSGDSLALPRPISYKPRGQALATSRVETFPWLVASALKSGLTNLARRGMSWDQFKEGLGIDFEDAVHTLEPTLIIAAFGYAEVWRTSDTETIQRIAAEYAQVLTNTAQDYRIPVFVVGLPLPGALLLNEYPQIRNRINIFNDALRSTSAIFIEPSPWLHSDQQHFSTAGHADVAERIVDAVKRCSPKPKTSLSRWLRSLR